MHEVHEATVVVARSVGLHSRVIAFNDEVARYFLHLLLNRAATVHVVAWNHDVLRRRNWSVLLLHASKIDPVLTPLVLGGVGHHDLGDLVSSGRRDSVAVLLRSDQHWRFPISCRG